MDQGAHAGCRLAGGNARSEPSQEAGEKKGLSPQAYGSIETGLQGAVSSGSMDEKQGIPILPFPSQREWESWLEEHHADATKGLWLKIAKKDSVACTAAPSW